MSSRIDTLLADPQGERLDSAIPMGLSLRAAVLLSTLFLQVKMELSHVSLARNSSCEF